MAGRGKGEPESKVFTSHRPSRQSSRLPLKKDSTMALRRSGWCMLLYIPILLALCSPTAGAPPDQPEASLDELLALYRAYTLPLPPDGARLVRFESGWWSLGKNGKKTPLDYLGFLIKPATADHPAVALVGTREFTLRSTSSKNHPGQSESRARERPDDQEAEYLFGLNSNLAFALQCKSRGWDGLAQAMLENRPCESRSLMTWVAARLFLRPSLAHTAWRALGECARRSRDTDRAKIADRMRALLPPNPVSRSRIGGSSRLESNS